MTVRTHVPLTARRRWSLRAAVVVVEFVVAATAIAGAVGMLADNAIGLPDAWLAATPFPTWAWPAVLLLAVVAVPMSIALVGEVRRAVWSPLASTLAGTVLMVWVVVQIIVVRHFFVLQPVLAAAGLVIVVLSGWLHRGGPPRRPTGRRVAMRRV